MPSATSTFELLSSSVAVYGSTLVYFLYPTKLKVRKAREKWTEFLPGSVARHGLGASEHCVHSPGMLGIHDGGFLSLFISLLYD